MTKSETVLLLAELEESALKGAEECESPFYSGVFAAIGAILSMSLDAAWLEQHQTSSQSTN